MFKKYYLLPVAAVVCLVFFMALPAMAQSQQQGQPGETQPEVSDADLEKVAVAYVEVLKISQEFQQAVQKTEDQSERQELQAEANKEMVLAVEDAGISVETYNNVMQQVRTNNELLEKFDEFKEEAQK